MGMNLNIYIDDCKCSMGINPYFCLKPTNQLLFFLYHTCKRERLSHDCFLPMGRTWNAESLNTWLVKHLCISNQRSDLTRLAGRHSGSHSATLFPIT